MVEFLGMLHRRGQLMFLFICVLFLTTRQFHPIFLANDRFRLVTDIFNRGAIQSPIGRSALIR